MLASRPVDLRQSLIRDNSVFDFFADFGRPVRVPFVFRMALGTHDAFASLERSDRWLALHYQSSVPPKNLVASLVAADDPHGSWFSLYDRSIVQTSAHANYRGDLTSCVSKSAATVSV
jgi:hypothetical protein